ncbi:MAG: iron export ABC transporter permease subunit FetB [Myxococcota bacterium]
MTAAPVSGWSLAGAAMLLLVNGALSIWLSLGLERKLLVASVRSVVQLAALGFVLVPVFAAHHPGWVVAWAVLMVTLAAVEATRRTSRTYRGMFAHAFIALALGAVVNAVLGTAVFIGVKPWWEPRYLIPLLGMILGNTLTGVSLGLDRALSQVDDGRGQVESMLALGATRWEATRPVAREAIRTGMVPILNAMSVVGLVTIPGMMTGQLLGGVPPHIAARYQILILFLIASTIAVCTSAAVLLGLRRVIDEEHRLRPERLRRR